MGHFVPQKERQLLTSLTNQEALGSSGTGNSITDAFELHRQLVFNPPYGTTTRKMQQKIGTVCDNYKVEMFEEEFKKAGIVYTKQPFTKNTTAFTCYSEQRIIKPIVDKVTQHFMNKYRKEN